MDVLAKYTVTSSTGEILHQSEQLYKNVEKPTEENKMLRSIAKIRKDLEKTHNLEFENKRTGRYSTYSQAKHEEEKPTKDKLFVDFETLQSVITVDKATLESGERRHLLNKIRTLETETLRQIALIYC